MDSRDTQEFYAKREMRKSLRDVRKRRYANDTKNAIAYMFSLALVFTLTVIMIGQLASCSTPPKLDAYEQHKVDVAEYLNIQSFEGYPHNQLDEMWCSLYIEAQLKNMGYE
jgi:hypothetical protein